MGGPFNSGLDCKEAVQPKELSCNVTLNNNQQKRSRVWTSWKDIYFTLFHFVKEVFKGSVCWAEKLSWTQPPQLYSLSCFLFLFLPQSLFVQEVLRIIVPSTHKASTWQFVHHSWTCPVKRSGVIWTFIISLDLLPVFFKMWLSFLAFFYTRTSQVRRVHVRCCVSVGAGEQAFQTLCCANRGCRNATGPLKEPH